MSLPLPGRSEAGAVAGIPLHALGRTRVHSRAGQLRIPVCPRSILRQTTVCSQCRTRPATKHVTAQSGLVLRRSVVRRSPSYTVLSVGTVASGTSALLGSAISASALNS